mgnify:CR=1 FL=1
MGRLSRAGEVKLVFSRRGRERSWVVLATNQRQWSAKTIVTHYLKRWGIEISQPHCDSSELLSEGRGRGYRQCRGFVETGGLVSNAA